ncbi:MAG: MgtC/SapB family protein [Bacilli bacterium]|nr:MgtC/SapB family protein [Bacilli bacterium]
MEYNKFLLGIIICFLLSFCLGLERQVRRRFIGLRTMILVAIGSYIFVSFSFLVTNYQIDVTRIAAQVVAGIGFLGAGVIIKDSEKGKIRGLTTAATLWCDAGIGILCAGGFIKEAIIASLLVLFSNIILRHINKIVHNKTEGMNINESFLITLKDIKKPSEIIEKITLYFEKTDALSLEDYEVNKNNIEMTIIVRKNNDNKLNHFIKSVIIANDITCYKYEKLSEEKILETEDEL